MSGHHFDITGAGLGLRRNLLTPLAETDTADIAFMEVAPENWIGVGGRLGKQFRRYTERFPFVCHGLSLSIGSRDPLNEELLYAVKHFMREHGIHGYSEHLSFCSDDGQLYDLLPIPFTEKAAGYVAERILRAQDILGQRIAIENASYYCAPGAEMSESDFINLVLTKADCSLLLDVNNIIVNSVNHGYDARQFLHSLPLERVAYAHIAGHYHEAEDLRVDTHGAPVEREAWQLLDTFYQQAGPVATLLERDFNIPPMPVLLQEVAEIRRIQAPYLSATDRTHGELVRE
ncbi:DUF692 domain-containing protein [Gilvimarinus agarilyticus]|uniref:HvfB family MNIO-type RiPP peptide maturase n=1 Tax=unclassified Gilvimarinus TaxID=2642066 RepID=UPI001C081AF7|nr:MULTISPECIES: DUF692 domain-containing protein [unclassified Gilvimarinus]MBU2885951.1 DUF692 domain-containing protein [Gilvimarinus agarilyticus]MDO6570697.1 DUF692 domain-containing protein [Gilvimarinus sp. 2_MG-2023]MDO6747710.1 DUF692 domain-containing protein [Gilvimarinus sp. 1_MG-2023]